MTLWRGITYHLFAGSSGNPKISLAARFAVYVCGVGLAGILAYRFTPHLGGAYATTRLVPLLFLLCTFGVLVAGLITDSQQRAFLTKLSILNYMPMGAVQLRKAYLYASLPINVIAAVIVAAALAAAFKGALYTPYLWLLCGACAVIAAFSDILLRIVSIPRAVAYTLRIAYIVGAAYLSQALFMGERQDMYVSAAGVYAVLQAAVLSWLVQRPTQAAYGALSMPLVEGKLTQLSAMGVRAMRTVRYVGTNVLFVCALAGTVAVTRSHVPFIPLDGAVLGLLLLVGTLGQEARTLSSTHHPVDLTLYGTLRTWVAGTWLAALINALVWIDLCLAAVLLSPYSLSVSLLQAGCMGLVMVAAGIAAGSIIVPQKQDIFAQCASTAVYGVFIWACIKLVAMPLFTQLHPFVWAAPLICFCLCCSYLWERARWLKDIRR